MLLASIASWALIFNSIGLNLSELACCSSVGAAGCSQILLPIIQVSIAGLNMLPIFFMYVVFARKDGRVEPPACMRKYCNVKPHHWAQHAFLALICCLILLGTVVGLLMHDTGSSRALADAFGVVSTLSTLFMWLPQIWRTFQDKSSGQLSIAMLCIQLPGNLAAVYFQAIMEQESFTTWAPYLCSSIEQALLLFMAVYYTVRARKRGSKTFGPGGIREHPDDSDDDYFTTDVETDIDHLSDAFASDFVHPSRSHPSSGNRLPSVSTSTNHIEE